MTTISPEPTGQPEGRGLLASIAMPLCIFSSVLAGLLLLSVVTVLPLLTRIELAGRVRTIADLRAEKRSLQDEIGMLEKRRRESVSVIQDPVASRLKERKNAVPSLLELRSHVQTIADSAASPGAVQISALWLDTTERLLAIRGDVRSVGPRSITVLASFVESLEALPGVGQIEQPRYVREEDPTLGFHSPFSLIVHLQ